VRFDDPNLVWSVGLVRSWRSQPGLTSLLVEGLTLAGKGTANAAAKIVALVGGMVAGADSISHVDVLRHGGMGHVFDDVRAPSTLGVFLRAAVHLRSCPPVRRRRRRAVGRSCRGDPQLPGADQWMFVEIDDTVRRTYGFAARITSCDV
jgi:hypothetical protein